MIIKNGVVYKNENGFVNEDLYIRDDFISDKGDGCVIDASECYVIPGLIDIHFHGCAGYDFCDGTTEAIANIAEYELKNGITSICPATMTLPESKLKSIMQVAAEYNKNSGANLVGINMEGPFLAYNKRGAQNERYLKKPDIEMFYRLLEASGGLIKLVSIAPEMDGAIDFIKKVSGNARVSIAHTEADYDVASLAFNMGATHVTHLYNGMNEFTHRFPGVLGAAYDAKNTSVEIICDGIHIHPSTVRMTFDIFNDDRIIMVSDSMMACGLDDGQYTLGGKAVEVKNGTAIEPSSGKIAGSTKNLMDCLRIAANSMGISLESAIKCSTINPAKALKIDNIYGTLEVGKKADLVILDKKLNIINVIKSGQIV